MALSLIRDMTKSIINRRYENRTIRYGRFNHFAETDQPPNTQCEQCGEPIYRERHTHGFRTFCGEQCRNAFYNSKRQRKASESRVCEQCGECFTAKRPDARYCSARCRQRARRSGGAGGPD